MPRNRTRPTTQIVTLAKDCIAIANGDHTGEEHQKLRNNLINILELAVRIDARTGRNDPSTLRAKAPKKAVV